MAQRVIYIVRDRRLDDCCKIGSDSAWPKRLRQAQSHSPDGIDLVGLWRFPDGDVRALRASESVARAGLQPRKEADGVEWVTVSGEAALRHVAQAFGRAPDETKAPPLGRPYDDWRSLTDSISGITYRRRLWVFEEQSPQRRVKIIHSIHFNGAYLYAFTWNPYRVRLAAAFEAPVDNRGPGAHWASSNHDVVAAWSAVLNRFGAHAEQRCCGWLPDRVQLQDAVAAIEQQRLRNYDLTGPKPDDVPVKDPSMSQSIDAGVVPLQHRVLPYLAPPSIAAPPKRGLFGWLRRA